MIAAHPSPIEPHGRRMVRAGLMAVGGCFAAPVVAWGQDGVPPHVLGLSAGASVLAIVLAIGAMVWARQTLKRERALTTELQRSRAEAHGLGQLLDMWQWRTDAQHRLVSLKPPRGAAAATANLPREKPLVWEHFSSDRTARTTLQDLISQHGPLNGVRVRQPLPGSGQWVLNGMAMLDAEGRFDGYLGTARELSDSRTMLLNEVLNTLSTPALRLQVVAPGEMPVLSGSNTAASLWLGDTPPGRLPMLELLHRLPAALRAAVEQAVTQPPAEAASTPTVASTATEIADGWTLRIHHLAHAQPTAGTEVLLVFHRVESVAPGGEAAHDDQASFSYTVSHDLRAPIRVVEGFTKIVKEDYGRLLDRIGNDHLDRVLGAAARMNSMIDSLLALSQLSSRPLARQPVNLSQLAGYIIDDLKRQSPERQVHVEIEPGLLAHGDATLLRVVLENLLGNAWKYTGKCRAARIWFERSEHEGRPAITVRDNGAGFDMRFADRLFGVFQRLHSANDFQGTGVGLASVRRIVRRHGGDIWAEGEVDKGARFQFWLGSSK